LDKVHSTGPGGLGKAKINIKPFLSNSYDLKDDPMLL